jgi:hypothetical protein
MIPALYTPGSSNRGAGAICVGQMWPKSPRSAVIRSGGAATIRSCWFLIFIGTSGLSERTVRL